MQVAQVGAAPMVEDLDPDAKRPAKSASAFRTISEVAQELEVPQHVLRFWESKFSQIKPLKRGGGRRYYRPEDVVLLRRIQQCLYNDGYTIKGVQRLLREGSLKAGAAEPAVAPPVVAPSVAPPGELDLVIPPRPAPAVGGSAGHDLHGVVKDLLRELIELRDMLRRKQG
jgi:DNA-binding transcriptional MerR regulator